MSENQEALPEKKEGMTQRTIRSVLWSSSGTAVQFIANVLIMVVLARLLTPAEFGVVGAAGVVIAFSQVLSQSGPGTAIVQRVELTTRHIRVGFTFATLIGLLISVLLWAAAPTIARFFGMSELTAVLRMLLFAFLLRSLGLIAEALLQRDMQFRTLASIQMISYVLGYGLVGIVLAWIGWGVWALVWAQISQTLIETGLFLLTKRHAKRPLLKEETLRELLYMGGGMTAAKLANQLALQGDNLIVGRTLGAEALGLYSRAYRLMALPANLLGDAVETVAFPALSQVQGDLPRLRHAFCRSFTLVALLALPFSIFVVLTAPEIIQVFLGAQWSNAVIPFQILTLGLYFRLDYKMGGSLARAMGFVYKLARLKVIYAVSVLAGAWIGHFWGLTGVATAVTLALAVHFVLSLRLSLRSLKMTWYTFLNLYRPALYTTIVVGLLTGISIVFLRQWQLTPFLTLTITTFIFIFSYFLSLRFMPAHLFTPQLSWWVVIVNKQIPVRMRIHLLPRTSKIE